MKRLRNTTRSQIAKERRQKFLRKLKFYSSAASLGAFACSSAANANIVLYDIPDVTITNDLSGVSQFIDIHADGPSNPDNSAPEWQIMAPGASNQIRIDTAFVNGPAGDEKPDHTDIGGVTLGQNAPIVAGQGNQLLSLFGNPGSVGAADPNPGYYTESIPGWSLISRASMSPSFYVGLAARDPYTAYNRVNVDKYVGLEWAFEGPDSTNRRYGWAQINVTPVSTADNPPGFYSATLTAYAFEMTPNTPIAAGHVPEPSSLALLAAGGGGLALAQRRRKRRS